MSSVADRRLCTMELTPFAPLIGAWDTEATHPSTDAVVTGRVTYGWLGDAAFVIRRATNDHPAFPDSISVIGAPERGDGLVAEYFDERGVRRTYATAVEDGILREWRDVPDFAQRAEAVLHPERFVLQWQLARTPGAWQDDVRVVLRRAQPVG